MIDSITLRLPLSNTWKDSNRVKLEVVKGTLIGYVDNIRIVQKADCLFVSGSIPKYHHGNNIQSVSSGDIMECVNRFHADTGLDLTKGVLCTIEIGFIVNLKESCSKYLELFSIPVNKTQVIYRTDSGIESIRYESKKNTSGAVVYLYDKIAECRKNSSVIPLEYQYENLLRIEYRLKNRKEIYRRFNRDLTIIDLTAKEILAELKSQFSEIYKNIPIMNRTVYIDVRKKLNKNDVYKLLAEQYRQNNPHIVDNLLSELKKKNLMESKTLSRFKTEINKMKNDCRVSFPNFLIEELNDKVSLFI